MKYKDIRIFDGAKWGDRFITRGGKEAIYIAPCPGNTQRHILIIKPYLEFITYCSNGGVYLGLEGYDDIVSRYHEEVDETALSELAHNEWHHNDKNISNDFQSGFVAGYKRRIYDGENGNTLSRRI